MLTEQLYGLSENRQSSDTASQQPTRCRSLWRLIRSNPCRASANPSAINRVTASSHRRLEETTADGRRLTALPTSKIQRVNNPASPASTRAANKNSPAPTL